MNLFTAFRTEFQFDQREREWSDEGERAHLLPPTTILGIPYQPDWLDILGIGLLLLSVGMAAFLFAIR